MGTSLTIYSSPAYEPRPQDYLILHLAMVNTPIREISAKVNEPQSVIKALLRGPWAQDQISRYHERFLAATLDRAFDHTRAFEAKLEEKIKYLDALTKDENPNVALRAIELWISHTVGSPVKRSEVTHKSPLDGLNAKEMAFVRDHRRLPTPEERLALNQPAFDIDSEVEDGTE